MSTPIRLIPLQCCTCQADLPADPDEVAWTCPQCGAGLLLSEEKGTVLQEIHFSDAVPAGASGRPFWVAQGSVELRTRQIFGGGDSIKSAQALWSTPRTFIVPAYRCTLDELVQAGTQLLLNPPKLTVGSAVRFQPVVSLPGDVQAYAEFIVLGIEAARKDQLKYVDFLVKLNPPELWILP